MGVSLLRIFADGARLRPEKSGKGRRPKPKRAGRSVLSGRKKKDVPWLEKTMQMRRRDGRAFAEYPPASQTRALLRKRAMAEYFDAVNGGASKGQAVRMAQALILRETGRAPSYRYVDRYLKIVNELGGIDAPDTAYLDLKSCPHRRLRKR
jgi:hypothetical protein